jgi:Zinc knuckle
MEIDIERAKELIAQREEIDTELAALFTGEKKKRSPQKCSSCDKEGHTARNCPNKMPAATI